MDSNENSVGAAARALQEEARALLDSLRARHLDAVDILDSGAEPIYDDIVALAAKLCNTRGAVLTFIAPDRAYVKASLNGPPVGNEPREVALCDTAVQTPGGVLCVVDARADQRFETNPKVLSGLLRAYLGTVVSDADGVALGALCVVDPLATQFSDGDISALQTLSRVVSGLLKTRVKPGAA